jgi:hypothetical protein
MRRPSRSLVIGIVRLSAHVTLAAMPGAARAQGTDHLGPAASDLRAHVACSVEAERRVLAPDEAAACSTAYMKVKLSFVPGIGLDEFERLPPREKAAVNLLAYDRYLDWSSRRPAEIAALRADALRASAFLAE